MQAPAFRDYGDVGSSRLSAGARKRHPVRHRTDKRMRMMRATSVDKRTVSMHGATWRCNSVIGR
jgi:hypothetical protein